jgi:hypothetical protein
MLRPKTAPGRITPKVAQRIRELHAQGLTTRPIAERLARDGTPISHHSVAAFLRRTAGPPGVRATVAKTSPPLSPPSRWSASPHAADITEALDADPRQRRAVDVCGGSVFVACVESATYLARHDATAPAAWMMALALGDPRELAALAAFVGHDEAPDGATLLRAAAALLSPKPRRASGPSKARRVAVRS